jgi:hypothetical protein
MPSQHPHAAEIAGVGKLGRWYQSCEGNWRTLVKGEPPMAPIEPGNGRAFEKCQAVKVGKRIGDVIVGSVNFSYAVNWLHLTPFASGLGLLCFRNTVEDAHPREIICS